MSIVPNIRRADHTVDPFYRSARATAQDKSISYDALGVLNYLLSKPDDWKVQPPDLERANCGRDKVYKTLNELIHAGYVQRIIHRDDKGKTAGVDYIIFEVKQPLPEKPDLENPDPEKPDPVPPDLEKPHITYKRKEHTKESTIASAPSADAPIALAAALVETDSEEENAKTGSKERSDGDAPSSSSKPTPPHLRVKFQPPVEDASPTSGKVNPDITEHPFVQFCMKEWNMTTLSVKLYKAFTREVHDSYEGKDVNLENLLWQWEKQPGFKEFARYRLEQFKQLARNGGKKNWAADYLSNLRKFDKETEDGNGWPGFREWISKNPSFAKSAKQEAEPEGLEGPPDEF